MSEPLIVGIRHHSPACARLVKSLIESQRPRYVLIEGPADFNDRVDELFLAHQLPVAIYSYCQYQDGAAPGRGAWTPFAEFSPEWQALQAARRIQAQTYFIDLPCWAQSEEVDDSPDTQEESQALLLRATRMDNSDTLWDHLFEDESQQTALPSALAHYFAQLRGDSPGDALNRLREAFMARWIGWAMQQNNGDVLVVCGGWHAPVLAKMWRECPQEINTPELPSLADAVTGCYLTPYSEKRLDVLAGYLSGMPAPVWQNWCWQWGLQQAGEQLLKTVLTRLRQHKLPASTADMAAAHLHAMALAQLRGHTLPLRTDWLDAIAGSLIKEALNAPLPWSYRGVIHPDTDPILLTLIDTLAGDGFGKLAPSTPQPPLPKDVTCELERTAISLPAELTLNRFNPNGLAQSQVLHRLAILRIRQLYAEGKVDRMALLESEAASYHAPGTCTFYGTANTNQMVVEFMGMQLPGSSFVHPDSPLRDALTAAAARQVTRMTGNGNEWMPIGKMIDEKVVVNGIVALLATGGSTNHTMHLVAMARAAGIQINWDDFSDLSDVVPLMARLYPNGPADINHFQAAGGVPVLVRELLKAGLLHEDVNTVAGFGLSRYTLEPWLNNGELDWREGAEKSLDSNVIASFEQPFSHHGGTKVLSGNLGRAVMKTSAVPVENQVIEAPAVVFESQHDVMPAFEAGLLDRDCVVVVRHQGPKANGMPELHKLMPPLGVLLDRCFKIALVTDGRLSGASGKVPSAIHVTPEAYDGGLLAKVRDGDIIRVNGQTGELTLLVDEAELAAREPHIPDLSASRVGTGRELFSALREKLSGAEQGATCITF